MTKIDIVKRDGTKESTLELPALFTASVKKELLHQAVVSYLANSRQSNAHTKTRGEISGGGRKPWKQKGTGRARAGSSRSPIWVGGGITFGPRSTANFTKRLPDKMKRLALSMALSAKTAANKIIVVEEFSVTEPKTKLVAQLISTIAPEAKSVLIVVEQYSPDLLRAIRNVPSAAIVTVNELNTYDILSFETVVFTKQAIAAIETLSQPKK